MVERSFSSPHWWRGKKDLTRFLFLVNNNKAFVFDPFGIYVDIYLIKFGDQMYFALSHPLEEERHWFWWPCDLSYGATIELGFSLRTSPHPPLANMFLIHIHVLNRYKSDFHWPDIMKFVFICQVRENIVWCPNQETKEGKWIFSRVFLNIVFAIWSVFKSESCHQCCQHHLEYPDLCLMETVHTSHVRGSYR